MEWVVGIQIDADSRIVYVHMDDLKRCAPPNPEPTWPDTARGTSIVVSTRAPSTLALSNVTSGRNIPDNTSHQPRSSAHHPQSVTSGQTDVRAPTFPVLRDSAHHSKSSISGQIEVRAPSNEENIVKTDTIQDSIVKTYAVPSSTWNLQDENCILSMKSNCLNKHSLTRLAHLYLTLRSRCTPQRLRQQEKCVYNESCCVGRHGSPSPRMSHADRCLSDWPRDCCIMTMTLFVQDCYGNQSVL